jgi:selenium-dependent xanthine dehydrogenase
MLMFWLNGERVDVDESPSEMLSDLLRYRLGLTGTKIGCNEAECGTCTVLLDKRPVFSCNLPARRVGGCQVTTIEGIAQGDELHVLQEAISMYGALQCGFCTPGLIITAYALLVENPDPSVEEIRTALKANLCRCGTYLAVTRAVRAAAEALRTGEAIAAPELPIPVRSTAIGRLVVRSDSIEKVTGAAKYTDDYVFPGMLHGRALRAAHPHAVLKKVDVSAAQRLAGVQAVLTADDIPGKRVHGVLIKDWPVLVGVGEKVRYVGDAVAIVAAETRTIANEALSLIETEYEPLPVVTDPVEAHHPDAPQVHEGGNLLKHIEVAKGEIACGIAEANTVLEDTYQTPFYEHLFMEPECSIARPTPDGRMEVYVGSQIPYKDRAAVAACLDLEEGDIRIIGTYTGGGFGGKEDIAGQVHAALLAQHTGRPVKILFDRHESLLVHPKRHATQLRVSLGAKHDGTLVAAQTELYGDTGAYASLGTAVMTRATTHSTGPYLIPHVKADCYAMYTNNPPAGALRGFGVLQSAFAIESAMDQLAQRLEIDPIALRRMNALREGSTTNTGQQLTESVGLIECIDRAEAKMRQLAGRKELFVSQVVAGKPSHRRAWGFAAAYKNTGLGGGVPDKAGAIVGLRRDGTLEVRTSSAEIGQGMSLVLQLIVGKELGIQAEHVQVLLSDTDLTPDGGATTASRQTFVTGNAVRFAAGSLRQAIAGILAERYTASPDSIEFAGGSVRVNGRVLSYLEIRNFMIEKGRDPWAQYEYVAPETRPLGEGGDMHIAFGFAAYGVEVEVDLATGEVAVSRVVAACDVGRAINPLGLLGQIEGGVIMGLGHALTEVYILEEGRVITDRMARYRMPNFKQAPEIFPIVVEHPISAGPYGAKGVGEITTIPVPPAITNAIYHACAVRVRKLPVDQDWLAQKIAERT